MVARDRTGATIDAVLPRLDAASITATSGKAITGSAELCCDGGTAIKAFARRAKVQFLVLPAPGSPLPEAPDLHINNVNTNYGSLKEWLRRFHGVAIANFRNYLGWRWTIEAFGTASDPNAWVMGAAGLGPYQQASRLERTHSTESGAANAQSNSTKVIIALDRPMIVSKFSLDLMPGISGTDVPG